MGRSSNDDRSDSMNPNNPAHHDGMDNHSNQLNSNNSAYWSSRNGGGCEDDGVYPHKSYSKGQPFGVPPILNIYTPEPMDSLTLVIYYVDFLGNSTRAWVNTPVQTSDIKNVEVLLQRIEKRISLELEQSSIYYLRVQREKNRWTTGDGAEKVFEAKHPFLLAEPQLKEKISDSINEIDDYLTGREKPLHLWQRPAKYEYKDFMQKVLGAQESYKLYFSLNTFNVRWYFDPDKIGKRLPYHILIYAYYVDHSGESDAAYIFISEPNFDDLDDIFYRFETKIRSEWSQSSLWHLKVYYQLPYRSIDSREPQRSGVVLEIGRPFASEDPQLQQRVSASVNKIDQSDPGKDSMGERTFNRKPYSWDDFVNKVFRVVE